MMRRAPVRWAIALPAAGVLAVVAASAVRSGTAGEAAFRAAGEVAGWRAPDAPVPEPGAVERLAAELESARRIDPDDPDIEELLGELAARRNGRASFLDESLRHYERAVKLRPTSPYAWAAIAATEYRLGRDGPRFQVALRRAEVLGPSEPEVQRIVIDFGLATWDGTAPATHAAVERAVTGAMERNAAEVLQVAGRRGRLAVACRHLDDAPRRVDPAWRRLCKGREAT